MEEHGIPNERSYNVYYRIAGHLIGILWPEQLDISACLPSFVAFSEEKPTDNKDVMMWVTISTLGMEDKGEEKRLLSDKSVQWGDRFRFEESEQAYITTVQSEVTERVWKMVSAKDFRQSVIYMVADEPQQGTILNWMLMVVYGQAILQHRTMLIHASVIKRGDRGFAFLGKSGTGKSTHSCLWLKHITGSDLLNDDNPVVRINEQERVWIYGSPWSGKTPCYRNAGVELAGAIRLRQGKQNRWTGTTAKEALFTLLPSCTAIRWNKTLFAKMVDIVEDVAAKVPVACLDCLPDKEAVYLCCQKLTGSLTIETE